VFNYTNCYYVSIIRIFMGLFDIGDDDVQLENADLDCEPQNEFVSDKEVAPLDDRLNPGEKVHYLFTGGAGLEINGEKGDRVGSTRTAITDERILIKTSKSIGTDYQTVRYENVSAVSVTTGMVAVAITIDSGAKRYKVRLQQAMNSEEIAHEVVEFIRGETSEKENQTNGGEDSESALDKLERLRDLKQDGIISEEELEEKKQDLMDDI